MRLSVAAALAACALLAATPAAADVGGTIDGPGLCDYPAVGVTVAVNPGVGQVVAFFCRWPMEANRSYYVQGYALYTTSGVAGGGMLGVNLSVGGGGGLTGFFCLDDPNHPTQFMRAADPLPIGAWKAVFTPTAAQCAPIESAPTPLPGAAPPPAPTPEPPPADQFATGAPSNPGGGNPDQTQNEDRHG